MRVYNETRGKELAIDAKAARSYWSRLVGLLGRRSLPAGGGLLIEPCSSVHTFFMRFTIDVVYLDRAGRVAKVAPNLRPFRVSALLRGGRSVVELPAGTIDATGTAAGDQLTFQP